MKNNRLNQPQSQVGLPTSHLPYVNKIGASLEAAAAITDCAQIMFALQAMPVVSQGDHCAGQGMAGGFDINPDSVSILLAHAKGLILEARRSAADWHVWSRSTPDLNVVGGHHG